MSGPTAEHDATEENRTVAQNPAKPPAPQWIGFDHVQLAIPVGGEDRARQFFVEVFGLVETPKPVSMEARGGAWFERGGVRLHVGVEDHFVAARKAHPAITIRHLREFIDGSGLAATLRRIKLPDHPIVLTSSYLDLQPSIQELRLVWTRCRSQPSELSVSCWSQAMIR